MAADILPRYYQIKAAIKKWIVEKEYNIRLGLNYFQHSSTQTLLQNVIGKIHMT